MRNNIEQYRVFFLKKTEKLSAVAYMLSGFFDDREPLKWRLRLLGLHLVDSANLLISRDGIVHEKSRKKLCDDLVSLKRSLHLSKTAEYVSEMNYALLERELDELECFLREHLPTGFADETGNALLGPAIGTLPFSERGTSMGEKDIKDITNAAKRVSFIRRGLQNVNNSGGETSSPQGPLLESIKRNRSDQNERVYVAETKDKGQFVRQSNMIHKGNGRQGIDSLASDVSGEISRPERILARVVGGEGYTIKDIAQHIHGVSEKTIQRDLQGLVVAGLLKRRGERRWSKYYRP